MAETGDANTINSAETAADTPDAPGRFYLASGLENAGEVRRVSALIRAAGWTQTYDWTAHGSVQGQGRERIEEVSYAEFLGVSSADVVVGLLPGGRGTHWELGIATGRGIPVVLYSADPRTFTNDAEPDAPRTCAFYFLPTVKPVTEISAILPMMERLKQVGQAARALREATLTL